MGDHLQSFKLPGAPCLTGRQLHKRVSSLRQLFLLTEPWEGLVNPIRFRSISGLHFICFLGLRFLLPDETWDTMGLPLAPGKKELRWQVKTKMVIIGQRGQSHSPPWQYHRSYLVNTSQPPFCPFSGYYKDILGPL